MKGPVKDLAEALKLPTLQAVADAIGEEYDTVRTWNSRKRIPSRVQGKIEALRSK